MKALGCGTFLVHGSSFVWMSFLVPPMAHMGAGRNWTLVHWVNVQLTTELPILSLYAFCDVAYRAKIAKQRVYVARVADLALLQQKTHVTSFTWQSGYADIKHNITKPIKVTARDQLVFHYDRIHVYVTLKLSEHERLKVALHQWTSYPPVIIMDLKTELETAKSYLTPHPCFSQSPATDHRHVVSLR